MRQLLREGVPIARIARELGVSRQTVSNWIAPERAGVTEHRRRRRTSKLDPHRAYVESRLERFDLPATVLLRELRKRGYTGGITILRELVASIKRRHVVRIVDRFETEPGRQAQVDFASCGTIEHDGGRRRLSLVTLVLGHSRVTWARFTVSQGQQVLMECLEEAFRELGGVPRELLFDNLKAVVATPRSREAAATIQRSFARFAEHWGFEPVPCPPYWPRAKGKVERAIQYIKRSFLEGRSFTDLDDLNAQLRTWLATVANVRIHATTGERPVDRLEADRAAMLPVGDTRAYPSAQTWRRLVDHDGRISFGGVRYSVDPSILGGRRDEPVEVHVGTDGRLRIHHDGRLVGEHRLRPSGFPPVDDPRHAALRRALRQRAPTQRPRGGAPRHEQRPAPGGAPSLPPPPAVEQRDLAVYEEVH